MGNEYGLDPVVFLKILGPVMLFGWVAIWLLVFMPLLLYPLARWKTHRENLHDPQLGLKTALHYFALIAFHLVLVGLFIAIWTLFSKESSSEKGNAYRAAFGFLLPAGGVLAGHLVLLRRTNQDHYPIVRRLFLGYNLLVTGLLGLGTLVYAFQTFLAKGSAGEGGRVAIALVLVYVSAWVACGAQFMKLVTSDFSPPPPQNVVPPPAPTATTQQSGPVLPPLSSGSYPPIDQK